MRYTIAWALLVGGLMGGGCNTTSTSVAPKPAPMHLFLLAGQSNMAGRGDITADRQQPMPGVYALKEDGSWGPAVDPIHWDKKIAGVGLARSFAREYLARNPGVEIGFIPSACGGSPIEVWRPGAYFEPTDSHPYDDAIARVAAVKHRGQLKGILWHQGETDSHAGRSGLYEGRLRELMEHFRRDLDDPELPMVVGQMGQFAGKPWTPDRYKVDAVHRRLAYEDDRIAFASSVGLTAKDDLVHFDTAALDELGRRYAAVWAQMIASSSR